MSLTIRTPQAQFVPVPEGSYLARCYLVVDLGRQISKKYNVMKEQVLIGWELDKYIDGTVPFVHIQQYCSANLNAHTKLRLLLENWHGKKFTQEEVNAFSLSTLLDQVCYLTLKHRPDYQCSSKLWADIAHIAPLPQGTSYNKRHHPLLHFDLDSYSKASFLALSQKIRNRINKEDLTKAEAQASAREGQEENPLPITEQE